MNRLDQLLHDGLRDATEPVGTIDADELSRRLQARRSAPGDRGDAARRRRPGWLVAAALLVVAGTTATIVLVDRRDTEEVVVQEPTTTTTTATTVPAPLTPEELAPVPPILPEAAPLGPIDQWRPGWYRVDTTSLPTLDGRSVWFGGEPYVTAAGTGEDVASTRVFRRDRDTGEWVELAQLDLMLGVLVAAGDHLVAVGEEGYAAPPIPRAWAVLDTDGRSWRPMGRVRPDPTRASASYLAPRLVWTGERVLDTTGAAVLDPATGTATPLEVPDEERLVVTFGTALWTGERAVLATWGPEPGYSWDARGRFLGEVPAAAIDVLPAAPELSQPVQVAVATVGEAVLAVAAPTWSPYAVGRQLPTGSDQWRDAPAPPMAPFEGQVNLFVQCGTWLGAARGTALALTCNAAGHRAAAFVDGRWTAIAVPEALSTAPVSSVESSEHAVTVGTTGSLLVWVPPR